MLVISPCDWYVHIKEVRAFEGYFGPPMRSKNKSCSSQVSSYKLLEQ